MRNPAHYLFFSGDIQDRRIILDRSETRHATAALRLKPGQQFSATDGNGSIFQCVFVSMHDERLTAEITGTESVSRLKPEIKLAIGLPERDHFEMIVEQATALGITTIAPVVFRFCQKPWWDRNWTKLNDRFARITSTSMKQCRYPYMPEIRKPREFGEMISGLTGMIVVADQDGASPSEVQKRVAGSDTLTVVIGPPGGITEVELEQLHGTGALPMRIARTRLRTELAAVVCCAQIMGWFI